MGSCFAREIKDHLEANGFNYVSCGDGPAMRHGSAPWERVYNTACIRQEIQRAFGRFSSDVLDLPDGRAVDPHRKNTTFKSASQAKYACETDAAHSQEALLAAEVFVVTLGLSEVWFDKKTGKAFAEPPPSSVFNEHDHGFKLLSPSENIENLQSALDLLKRQNPNIQVILTVSPIPLRATFLKRSAIVSNNVSKSSLVWAAHEIVDKYNWVHYFPSYEIVTTFLDNPFDWDARHVTREAAVQIMQMFETTYLLP